MFIHPAFSKHSGDGGREKEKWKGRCQLSKQDLSYHACSFFFFFLQKCLNTAVFEWMFHFNNKDLTSLVYVFHNFIQNSWCFLSQVISPDVTWGESQQRNKKVSPNKTYLTVVAYKQAFAIQSCLSRWLRKKKKKQQTCLRFPGAQFDFSNLLKWGSVINL